MLSGLSRGQLFAQTAKIATLEDALGRSQASWVEHHFSSAGHWVSQRFVNPAQIEAKSELKFSEVRQAVSLDGMDPKQCSSNWRPSTRRGFRH